MTTAATVPVECAYCRHVGMQPLTWERGNLVVGFLRCRQCGSTVLRPNT